MSESSLPSSESAASSPSRPAQSRLVFRVRYVECDPMGYLHHSNFLPFFEMGRTEMLRASGISYRELEERDVLFAVTKGRRQLQAPRPLR